MIQYVNTHLLITVSLQQVKVKVTLEQTMKVQRGSRHISTLSLTWALDWGWMVKATPRAALPSGKDRVPFV